LLSTTTSTPELSTGLIVSVAATVGVAASASSSAVRGRDGRRLTDSSRITSNTCPSELSSAHDVDDSSVVIAASLDAAPPV